VKKYFSVSSSTLRPCHPEQSEVYRAGSGQTPWRISCIWKDEILRCAQNDISYVITVFQQPTNVCYCLSKNQAAIKFIFAEMLTFRSDIQKQNKSIVYGELTWTLDYAHVENSILLKKKLTIFQFFPLYRSEMTPLRRQITPKFVNFNIFCQSFTG